MQIDIGRFHRYRQIEIDRQIDTQTHRQLDQIRLDQKDRQIDRQKEIDIDMDMDMDMDIDIDIDGYRYRNR